VNVAKVAKLGPQGLAATLKVTYQCPADHTAGLGGILKQPAGNRRIADAYGFAPAICDGLSHVVPLQVTGNQYTFKPGKATSQVTLAVDDPATAGTIDTTTGLRPVTLRK
jgi:hypothetical protein